MPLTIDRHERFMRVCLKLAERGKGRVSPNPLVGAVLVRNGEIIARGWHHAFGQPHAEVDCLSKARGDLRNVTLYVTLEPCSHYGKTPPCSDKIISSGVGSVVFAMKDPNPLVTGRGVRALRAAGIEVIGGVLEGEARYLNRFFLKHITTRSPYVHVKIAQTIDGYIAGPRAPRWISCPESLRLVHQWRAEHDAVLVGARTVRMDNPLLTVRHVRGRDPHVVIVDGSLSIPEDANALRRLEGRGVFVCVGVEAALRRQRKVTRLEERGIAVLRFNARRGKILLKDVMEHLYRFSIGSVLVEGGSSVFTQAVDEGLVDELSVFVAPIVLGGGVPAFRHTLEREAPLPLGSGTVIRRVGRDVLFNTRFTLKREGHVHRHH